jgi:hypothetical protein
MIWVQTKGGQLINLAFIERIERGNKAVTLQFASGASVAISLKDNAQIKELFKHLNQIISNHAEITDLSGFEE